MKLDFESKRESDAIERYKQAENKGLYSDEVFYQLLADNDELENIYKSQRLNLEDGCLNGIILGFLRQNNYTSALKVSQRLNELSCSTNSEILVLFCNAIILFNEQIKGKHLWILTATQKSKIDSITEQTISLITKSKGEDERLFHIAVACLNYDTSYCKDLADICWKYVEKIEKISSTASASLYSIYANDCSKFEDGFHVKCIRARRDEEYKKQSLKDIFSSKTISEEDFIFIEEFSDVSHIID